MTDIKYFHAGQFFSKRAFISTIIGVCLIVVTEWLIPYLGLMPKFTEWITPAVIIFTIAVILLASTMAKNVVASLILGIAAAISFYNPYESYNYGYVAILIMYLIIALLGGYFAGKEMTGQAGFRLIGIVFGFQAILGAGINLLLSKTSSYQLFWWNGIREIAIGNDANTFPCFDVIVAGVGFLYMLFFILLGTRVHSTTSKNKAYGILGHIIIFIALAGALAASIFLRLNISQTQALEIIGDENTIFLNSVFQKSITDDFSVLRLLNIFYVLPIVGMVIGIGLALIVYKRAEGTTGRFRFNFEGAYFNLNITAAITIGVLSYYWYQIGASTFYLKMRSWYILFTLFTNLLLINLIVVFIISLFLKIFIKKD